MGLIYWIVTCAYSYISNLMSSGLRCIVLSGLIYDTIEMYELNVRWDTWNDQNIAKKKAATFLRPKQFMCNRISWVYGHFIGCFQLHISISFALLLFSSYIFDMKHQHADALECTELSASDTIDYICCVFDRFAFNDQCCAMALRHNKK